MVGKVMTSQKVALVTGASRGIGAATAVALAKEGYAVGCAARSTREHPHRTPGTIDGVVDRIRDSGGNAIAVPVDLADREQVVAMVERTVDELGRLDILVNNAAASAFGGWDLPLAEHDSVMAVNFDAPFIASRQAIPHLRSSGEGRILNVSSQVALQAFPGTITSMSYGVAKIALERMTVDLAQQLQSEQIAVNCFRVDSGVASEGAYAVMPDMDLSGWETPEVAADGMTWMLRQPVTYTGRLESMVHLAQREGVMPTVAARTSGYLPPAHFP